MDENPMACEECLRATLATVTYSDMPIHPPRFGHADHGRAAV